MDTRLLYNIFDPQLLDSLPDEWDVVIHDPRPGSIGFATTLTPAVIRQAADREIHLLVTHHNAWEFMREERLASSELLGQHHISHVWCHAPLDRVDFGNTAALLALTGCKVIATFTEGYGLIGELPEPLQLSAIREVLDDQLSENPCKIFDANRSIKRIACVPGAGANTGYLAEALEYEPDLYLTGETSLYLLEYASFHNVSVLIYSHNYTEIFGTQNLAGRIAAQLGIHDIFRLDEPHF